MIHLDPSVHKCLQRGDIRDKQLGEWSAGHTLKCRCQRLPVPDLRETFYGNEAWIQSEAPVWRTCRWRPWTEPVEGAASCCEGPTALRPKTVLVPWPKAVVKVQSWVERCTGQNLCPNFQQENYTKQLTTHHRQHIMNWAAITLNLTFIFRHLVKFIFCEHVATSGILHLTKTCAAPMLNFIILGHFRQFWDYIWRWLFKGQRKPARYGNKSAFSFKVFDGKSNDIQVQKNVTLKTIIWP